MEWYQVTKTINGRKYLYWQKTYRVGSSVKTLNKYIGPGANPPRIRSLRAQMESLPERHKQQRKQYDAGTITKTEYLEAITTKPEAESPPVQPDSPSPTRQPRPEGMMPPLPQHTAAMEKLDPFHGLDAKWRKRVQRAHAIERRDDERIQYGPLKQRILRAKAKFRAAKRNTRGIKSLNPFMAQALMRAKIR